MQIEIEDLKRINVRPGDVFVYRPKSPMDMAQAARLKEHWSRVFPDNRLAVLSGDGDLFVLRDELQNGSGHVDAG